MIEQTGVAEPYSFRGKLAAAFWKRSSVRDRSMRSMLTKLRVRLPNVNAIAIKTNSGHKWMSETTNYTDMSDMDIYGVGDVKRWVETCAGLQLDCIAWCVVETRSRGLRSAGNLRHDP
jgi:hypothetical protein